MDELAVATIDEAIALTSTKISKPINILGNIDKSHEAYYHTNIYPTIACIDDIKYLLAQNFSGKVNVKVNTGMNRIGVKITELKSIICFLLENNLQMKSIFTHFYNSSDIESVKKQFKVFKCIQKDYSATVDQFHACASNCLDLPSEYHLNMVRVGLAMYGYGNSNLLPAMTVKTNILQIINVKQGENIGYGDIKALKNCTIAAIRAGYGDGFRRKLNNSRFVCVCGKLCQILGQICMDICMVDVSAVQVDLGTPIYLVNNIATVGSLAEAYETIDYEVLTSFGERAKRIYVK